MALNCASGLPLVLSSGPVLKIVVINMVLVIASEAKQSRAVELNPGEIASSPSGLGSVCSAASLRCFPSTPSG
jgi:hypothetical protein